MKVSGTGTSQPPPGGEPRPPATPRPDRLRRGFGLARQTRGQPREGCRAAPSRDRTLVGRSRGSSEPGPCEERTKEDLGGEPETHGRIGCPSAGNRAGALRTRQRSKALESTAPRWTRRARRTSNGRRIGWASRAPAPPQPRRGGVLQRGAALRDGVDLVHDSRVSLARTASGPARVEAGHLRAAGSRAAPGQQRGARSSGGRLLRRAGARRRQGASPRGASEVAQVTGLLRAEMPGSVEAHLRVCRALRCPPRPRVGGRDLPRAAPGRSRSERQRQEGKRPR
jgi:hypothetical protein